MKKIMIACAVVVMAAVAQAASIDWSFTETANNSKNPVDLSGYTAYLFTESAWNTFAGLDSDQKTLANFKGYTDSAAITGSAQGSTRTKFTTGVLSTEGATGNYFIILANNDGYTASASLSATAYASATEQHTPASWTITAGADPLQQSNFTAFASGTVEPEGPTGDVPEPTSGLLLLVGAAALALKRKVA
jgi:hypothetical protein